MQPVAGVRRIETGRVQEADVPVEVDVGEHDLEDQGEPEDRRREGEEAEGRGEVVQQRILAYGRVHADPDRDEERDRLRRDHELEGVRHHPREVVPDRPVAEQCSPELVGDRLLDPVEVPDGYGAVQVLLVLDPLDRLLRDVRPHPQRRQRVADVRDEREDEEARDHEHRHAVEHTPQDVREHARYVAVRRGSGQLLRAKANRLRRPTRAG